MTKKLFLTSALIAAMCALSLSANAQFGKALKKAGKSVTKAVGDVAGDMASDMVANKVSVKIVEFMDQNNTIAGEGTEYYTRLANLVGTDYITVDGLSLNYKVYENPEVNILATADGSIRVYTGMMDLLSDEELLAVISTQIGHIANKDVRDALLKVASEDNATKAGSAQLEKLLSFSGDKMGTIINELLQVPYTDEQNKKADSFAFDLLSKKGTSTDALVSALEKFAELESADQAASEEDGELSAAAKFIGVNSNNALRASIISYK
ncbi:M48 family metalloprotease [Dysgonomonas sp. Marseille-P4677]|uniref:M48 family metalloprotease n=1 Tax=Dysgonomonas sp. Marseille-P4677 TaxID=2364790 RepID=UPI00191398E8|nr:M48 family metalloprotease [Dysgonomonas sp. Marseille-P4677]MBK5722967.1 M48 family metalloprotease [Dysgonomonas sp. Marseille-P4677]